VTGQVVNGLNGNAIAGAKVELVGLCVLAGDGTSREQLHAETVSDRDGKFVFENQPAISVSLSATQDGYIPLWAVRQLADDPNGIRQIGPEGAPVTLQLAPLGSISGTVRNERGELLREAWVTIRRVRPWAGWSTLDSFNAVQTGADGSYRFIDLWPGRYFLLAEPWKGRASEPYCDARGLAFGYLPQLYPAASGSERTTTLPLGMGEQLTVDFQLQRAHLHHVSGTVAGGGQLVGSVQVFDANGSDAYITSDPSLCCHFDAWLPDGSFRIDALFGGADGWFRGSAPVKVAGTDLNGVALSLTRSEANQSNKLAIEISASDAAPPQGCPKEFAGCGFWYLTAIRALPNGYSEAGPQSTQSGALQRDSHVRFESIDLPDGTYYFAMPPSTNAYAASISSGETDLVHNPLRVAAGQRNEPILIVLAEGAEIEGVTTCAGRPCKAWVNAISDEPAPRLWQPERSGVDGKFLLQGLMPASYLLFATDAMLSLDIHDEQEIAPWRAQGVTLKMHAGKNDPVNLGVIQVPLGEEARR
jgi:hypothetical protein